MKVYIATTDSPEIYRVFKTKKKAVGYCDRNGTGLTERKVF